MAFSAQTAAGVLRPEDRNGLQQIGMSCLLWRMRWTWISAAFRRQDYVVAGNALTLTPWTAMDCGVRMAGDAD